MRLGIWILGLASAAAGVLDIVWGEFEAAHQPIQALGANVAHMNVLAYIGGLWLIVGGLAILYRRTARGGALVLAGIYLLFAMFWIPRFYTATKYLGFRMNVLIGVLDGMGTQLIVVAAAMIVFAFATRELWGNRAVAVARWIFGLSSVVFGVAHLMGTRDLATMVPSWMPLGGPFWVGFTGVCFILAGIAILSRVQDVLAARLLALMLLVFSVIALAPNIVAYPHNHIAWGANAYNLAAVGATWIFAEALANRRTMRDERTSAVARVS